MGFFDKIKKGLEKTRRQMGGIFAEFTGENEEFYEELEDSLILAGRRRSRGVQGRRAAARKGAR